MKLKAVAVVLFTVVSVALPLRANPAWAGVVLVPINPGTVAGAGGSQWITRLWATNTTDVLGRIEADTPNIDDAPTLAPHSTILLDVPYKGLTHPGFFIHTRSATGMFGPPDIWFELRTLDSVSASHTAGTSIPLPTLKDFRTGTIVFPNVPANGHSRIKLRVYSISNATVAVRVYDGAQLVTSTVAGTTGDDGGTGPAPRYPAYAEVDIANPAPTDALHVEVDATVATWAFISVTDDVTNEFTIVAPHLPDPVTLSLL